MSATIENNYQLLIKQAEALVGGESDWAANTADVSALSLNALNDVSFASAYRYKNHGLIPGLFQEKPTCVYTATDKGACGTTVKGRQTQIVKSVHELTGHIACDSDLNSKIVIPTFRKNGELWGVFDFDSTRVASFDELDQRYLEAVFNTFKF